MKNEGRPCISPNPFPRGISVDSKRTSDTATEVETASIIFSVDTTLTKKGVAYLKVVEFGPGVRLLSWTDRSPDRSRWGIGKATPFF